MTLRAHSRWVLVASTLLAAGCSASAGSSGPCGPGTCETCCDAAGACVAAVSASACPADGPGSACASCGAGESCYAGPGRCGAANPALAFVTHATFDGDLKSAGGGATGLDGGDRLCQAAAVTAGLSGTFKAWLSDSTTNAIDRLADVGGWYAVSSYYPYPLFAEKAQLATGPSGGFMDEYGASSWSAVWTGTEANGTRSTSDFFQGTSANCLGWTVNYMDSGVLGGNGHTSGLWTDDSAQQCQNRAALYCFEQ